MEPLPSTPAGTSILANIAGATRRCVCSPGFVPILWAINVVALGGLLIWVLSDGQFADAILALRYKLYGGSASGWDVLPRSWNAKRVLILESLTFAAGTSALAIFLSLFFGPIAHRRLRSWFAFTLLVAAWLTLFASWRELAWRGQVIRLQHRLDEFETIAESFRFDWPNIDGERPHMGRFMAYPIDHPTTLMMLETPDVPRTKTSFSSVERGEDGSLRFQLAGDEFGTWLEWHPPKSVPQTFLGGLLDRHSLERYSPLGQGWYLVRYE